MKTLNELKNVLETNIKASDRIFITFHKKVDIDAIASAIGMNFIVKKLGKTPYILLEEDYDTIEKGAKKIIDKERNNINIINNDIYNNIKTDNDLLIVVDTNKVKLVSCNEFLDEFKNIIIIDHHKEEVDTINTNLKYIDTDLSSGSEIIGNLLNIFKYKYTENISDYLLAGICLDTNKYTINCSYKTMELVSKLLKHGANTRRVNELFEEDYTTDRKIQELVGRATFITQNLALCIADEKVKYSKEELAKVVDYLLKYKVDAAFAAGFINNEMISINARSKGEIDVNEIMKEFGGGGHIYSAASQVNENDIEKISIKLNKILNRQYKIEKND